jgi:hypothetical protein
MHFCANYLKFIMLQENFYFISKVKPTSQKQLFYFTYIYIKLMNFGSEDVGKNIYKVKSESFFLFLQNKMELAFSSTLNILPINSSHFMHFTNVFVNIIHVIQVLRVSYHYLLRIY